LVFSFAVVFACFAPLGGSKAIPANADDIEALDARSMNVSTF